MSKAEVYYAEVYVIVEGRTEQTFVRDLLAPILSYSRIYLTPILTGKPGHQGGNEFKRAKSDIRNHLRQRSDTYISTMFDYYAIDKSWPGRALIHNNDTAVEKARKMEQATLSEIKKMFPKQNIEKRFIPYIAMHEFEALLFSDIDILADKIGADPKKIEAILKECGEPEEIDDNPQTAPSKRLQNLCHNKYRKVAMGKTIAAAITIQTIRKQCPHFNEWLSKLESLIDVSSIER